MKYFRRMPDRNYRKYLALSSKVVQAHYTQPSLLCQVIIISDDASP
jgi:hypothetical protein